MDKTTYNSNHVNRWMWVAAAGLGLALLVLAIWAIVAIDWGAVLKSAAILAVAGAILFFWIRSDSDKAIPEACSNDDYKYGSPERHRKNGLHNGLSGWGYYIGGHRVDDDD